VGVQPACSQRWFEGAVAALEHRAPAQPRGHRGAFDTLRASDHVEVVRTFLAEPFPIELAYFTLISDVSTAPTGYKIVREPVTATGAAGLPIDVAHHDRAASFSRQAKLVTASRYARSPSSVAYSEEFFTGSIDCGLFPRCRFNDPDMMTSRLPSGLCPLHIGTEDSLRA
jgi:hypothetical protein